MGERILDNNPAGQIGLFAQHQDDNGGYGHNTQSAGLDKKRNDELAQCGKGGARVHHGKPGDADRRSGRKKRIDKPDGGGGSLGHHQKAGAGQYEQRKGDNGKVRRRLEQGPEKFHPHFLSGAKSVVCRLVSS